MYVSVIIAAAGSSTRMGSDVSKQLLKISGKTVLEYSLDAFSSVDDVKEIIISAKKDEIALVQALGVKYTKLKAVVEGGKIRQESVIRAVEKVSDESEMIAIHDAARPLIKKEDIEGIIKEASIYGAVCPVSKVVDTIKQVSDGVITNTLDREHICLASTPQAFNTILYKKALSAIKPEDVFTDDCSIVENIGEKVHVYLMNSNNTKITKPKDFNKINELLEHRTMRIGHGYDVHKLVSGRRLILGGVEIPHEKGLLGHSDADVLVHAIMDALLGAAAMGDIGRHFPDTSDEFEGISSILLLKRVNELLKSNGFSIGNIDATIVAQAPKLSPYIQKMVENIAEAIEVDKSFVNVKATTEEHLGFTGEKLGIAAHAIASLN